MERLITFTPSDPPKPEIDYPESDGEPMGETQFHVRAILFLYQALEYYFRANDEMYVSADMLFYYEEGNPSAFKVSDVFVVRGVSKHTRRIYKLWEEQVAPCTVFEITSRGTWLQDMGDKRTLYEKLGVSEYFMFDPEDEYLSPRLQGFQLIEGVYQPMALAENGTLYSHSLDVILKPENEFLRIVDPQTKKPVPTLDEVEVQIEDALSLARDEADRAQAEAERADTAEAEIARLQAELKRLQRQSDQDA